MLTYYRVTQVVPRDGQTPFLGQGDPGTPTPLDALPASEGLTTPPSMHLVPPQHLPVTLCHPLPHSTWPLSVRTGVQWHPQRAQGATGRRLENSLVKCINHVGYPVLLWHLKYEACGASVTCSSDQQNWPCENSAQIKESRWGLGSQKETKSSS